MLLNEEQSKLRALVTEAIAVLCRNGLSYQNEVSVEGLLGITTDNQDVFLISLNEIIRHEAQIDEHETYTSINTAQRISNTHRPGPLSSKNRKRSHSTATVGSQPPIESDSLPFDITPVSSVNAAEPPSKRSSSPAAIDSNNEKTNTTNAEHTVTEPKPAGEELKKDSKPQVEILTENVKTESVEAQVESHGDTNNEETTHMTPVPTVSSPRQQFWIVDGSNNVISISEDVSDTSSTGETQGGDVTNYDGYSPEQQQQQECTEPSDDIASVAAAAVDFVINKVDKDVMTPSDDVTHVGEVTDDDEDDVKVIGNITIPHDQSQLISLYSGVQGRGVRSHQQVYRPQGHRGAGAQAYYVCDLCGAKMKSSIALKYHKMHVHKIGISPGAYNMGLMNVRTTQSQRMYPQVSPPVFPTPSLVDGDTYKCSQCSKTFKTAQGLKYHNMHHTGNYPYWCGQCKKGFVVQTHYKEHQAKHEGTMFPCEHCEREFQTFSSLRIHKANHHATPPGEYFK